MRARPVLGSCCGWFPKAEHSRALPGKRRQRCGQRWRGCGQSPSRSNVLEPGVFASQFGGSTSATHLFFRNTRMPQSQSDTMVYRTLLRLVPKGETQPRSPRKRRQRCGQRWRGCGQSPSRSNVLEPGVFASQCSGSTSATHLFFETLGCHKAYRTRWFIEHCCGWSPKAGHSRAPWPGPRSCLRRDAGGEAGADFGLVQFAANEDQLAAARLVRVPETIGRGVEHHLDALEHHALGLAFDVQHALAAVDVRTQGLQEFTQPRFNLLQVEGALFLDVKGMDRFVVVMVRLFVAMLVIMIVVVVVMFAADVIMAVLVV